MSSERRRESNKARVGVLEVRRQTVGGTLSALRESREAVEEVDARLDDALVVLQNPDGTSVRQAADRLRAATDKAAATVESLPDNSDLFA